MRQCDLGAYSALSVVAHDLRQIPPRERDRQLHLAVEALLVALHIADRWAIARAVCAVVYRVGRAMGRRAVVR